MPLVIAGIVQDQRYFDERVAPRIDGERVSFVGAVSTEERSELLGGAHALLHLIGFDEPFGYSVVEAMACGTPVIAFRRGSMGELIEDGTTGFLVDAVAGAVAAVDRAASARPCGDPGPGGRPVRRRADGRRLPRGLRRGPPSGVCERLAARVDLARTPRAAVRSRE